MRAIGWVFVLLLGMAFAASATEQAAEKVAEKAADPGEDAQLQRLTEARQFIDTGRHDEAIALIDQTLAYYARKYPEGRTRWYVVRTPEENLLYLASAAVDGKSSGKTGAMTLDVLWADAHYLKAYALYELDRLDAAAAELGQALQLTPRNARYLSELGNIHQTRHEWEEARRQYQAAEAAAEFSPAEERIKDLTRAKRGIGFVLIEQGDLDAAEAQFKACLKLDPDDRGAQNELEYIAQQRAKAKQI
jgi:tetratricopeptide (TPR) repeat protein